MAGELIYPNGPDDRDGIKAYIEALRSVGQSHHDYVARFAERNIHYILGNQWISLYRDLNRWRPMALKASTPRPVTNRVSALFNQGVSNLISFKPPITYAPQTDDPTDVAAAVVADKVNQVIEKETHLRCRADDRPVASCHGKRLLG